MRLVHMLRAVAVAFVVALGASSAWAQSYTVSSATGQWVSPPASATVLSAVHTDDSPIGIISLPFSVPYWGVSYSTLYVCSNGHVSFVNNQLTSNYSPLALPIASGNSNDGIIMIAQRDLDGRTGSTCNYWNDGTIPNRRFVVSYSGWQVFSGQGANSLYFQVQFYESGKIVLAYTTNSTGAWFTSSYGVGLDRPGTSDYITPLGTSTNYTFTTTPTNDWVFIPPITITGRVLFDRYLVNSSGIGAVIEQNLPFAGMRIEERDASGNMIAFGTTNSTGDYNFTGGSIPLGSIVAASGSTACIVRKVSGGATYGMSLTGATPISLASNLNVGTITLNEGADPGGVLRAPLNIAYACQTEYAWAVARTIKSITQLEILYDTTSIASTSYTAKGANPATMRVASALSGNADPWDTAVIRKVYARHILGAIAGDPVTAYDATFDKTTDDQNAFAEGFGYYMNAIISRDTKYFDATSSTAVTAIDMESPANLPATKGSNIAGWCAAALYDLTDGGTNESWDTFDGSGAAGEQVFLAAASLSTQATAGTFFTAWVTNKGYDGTALARDFIRHGLLPDDADEPNDYPSEATPIVQFGFVRKDRALTQFNDDYYKFTMAYPTNVLTVDCVYDRVVYSSAVVLLELQNSAGAVLATGSPLGASGAIEAKSGALPAGDYVIRVKLTAGGPLPKYALQAFSELAFTSGTFPTWTVGRPINVPVNITGGIPPYDLVVPTTFKKPEGLVLDGVNLRVTGTPTGPQDAPIPPGGSHVYPFILSAVDSATPTRNSASGSVTFTVNDALKQHFSPFLAFAFGKPVDRPAPFAGGTPPYTASIGQGALPHGVAAEGGAALRFTGTPDSPGSYAFTMTGTDIAGSADTASTTGVACLPLGQQAALAPGASACGFYFDAVKGSTVSLTVATVRQPGKRAAPRALRATILDVDGSTVLVEPKTKATRGRVAGGKFVAPSTGRFYFVVSSDDAGAQALLSVKARTVANKGGKGDGGPKNLVSGGAPFNVEIGAIGGAVLTFTAKPERFSGLLIQAAHLLDPAGRQINFADGEVNERPDGSITFRRTLPISGTWTVVLAAYPGPQGKFTYAFTVKEPPGAVFSAD